VKIRPYFSLPCGYALSIHDHHCRHCATSSRALPSRPFDAKYLPPNDHGRGGVKRSGLLDILPLTKRRCEHESVLKDACLNSPLRAAQFRRRSDAGELGEGGALNACSRNDEAELPELPLSAFIFQPFIGAIFERFVFEPEDVGSIFSDA